MLSREDNELLCRIGPTTPTGDLLRQYWLPFLPSTELPEPDGPPKKVRLLGENLVAFRDTQGAVGLFPENCPHRGASLFFGRNEECGACVYHAGSSPSRALPACRARRVESGTCTGARAAYPSAT